MRKVVASSKLSSDRIIPPPPPPPTGRKGKTLNVYNFAKNKDLSQLLRHAFDDTTGYRLTKKELIQSKYKIADSATFIFFISCSILVSLPIALSSPLDPPPPALLRRTLFLTLLSTMYKKKANISSDPNQHSSIIFSTVGPRSHFLPYLCWLSSEYNPGQQERMCQCISNLYINEINAMKSISSEVTPWNIFNLSSMYGNLDHYYTF